ncbi:MAG: hypothetical protein CL912_12985 [Deltaproteobacteria bacterium]|nr:hypothetical protein [Deltaproteobacteria bacterium]
MASETLFPSKASGNAAADARPASPSKDSENVATGSATEENFVKDYIIYPADSHNTDSISLLLASYPPAAKVVSHISVRGWGMMYWEATSFTSPVARSVAAQAATYDCYWMTFRTYL